VGEGESIEQPRANLNEAFMLFFEAASPSENRPPGFVLYVPLGHTLTWPVSAENSKR
jgi:hypothetical protein